MSATIIKTKQNTTAKQINASDFTYKTVRKISNIEKKIIEMEDILNKFPPPLRK